MRKVAEKPENHRLRRLRELRNGAEPDRSLAFLPAMFHKEVAKPYQQLAGISRVWAQVAPEPVQRHARLESLSRGVLHVAVDSSAALYELERLLRSGLREALITRNTGPAIRRVAVRLVESV